MTIANMRTKIEKQRIVIIMQVIMFVAVTVLVTMLVREKSYWQGYNEAYDTGVKSGWQSCIEENNLYERYEHGE